MYRYLGQREESARADPALNSSLALAQELQVDSIYAIAADTDGVDGNGESAGAMLRPDTMKRAKEMNLDPEVF